MRDYLEMDPEITRRELLQSAALALSPGMGGPPRFRISVFSADVTPPVGHPCMGGGIAPVQAVDDPLFAKGSVLLGAGRPIVVCAVDWCEIRNDAYERWRMALAEAAGTGPERVLITS